MAHETLTKFGYPGTVLREYSEWVVCIRPKQATLGSLVLIAKSEVVAFPALPDKAFEELPEITDHIEDVLRANFGYDKINYLMLMMVDPHVHFHVIPRYGQDKSFQEMSFTDPGWPGPPELGHANAIDGDAWEALVKEMRDSFAKFN